MSLSDVLDVVRLTDVGLVRDHNEDAIASDDEAGIVILADGMGGYKSGEVASEMAVLSITAELKEALMDFQMNEDIGLEDDELQYGTVAHKGEAKLISDAVIRANDAIYSASQMYPQCAGMGTTLVLGLFVENALLVGHIGDSRLYRLRKGTLLQMTEDHSLLHEQLKIGLITAEQARFSSNRNILTRALGVDPEVQLELNEFDVEVDDIYLLCSDGLSDMVDDVVIESTLNAYTFDLLGAAESLVRMANDNGGKDNVSVVLVKVKSSFSRSDSWYDNLFNWLR